MRQCSAMSNWIEQLHSDEDLRRRQFPVAGEMVFLGNAGVCPLPHKAAVAMADYAVSASFGDQETGIAPKLIAETRGMARRLLGVGAEDIALLGPTSLGLSLVANGLDWQEGDNVVFAPDDYPSNAVVWMDLERRGVELRQLVPDVPGYITAEMVEPLIDERTRLVALSSAHFITGYRLPVEEIGPLVQERGALFSLDSIQTLGAIRTPLDHVDFAPADSHKWLLGPCGAGLFYVSERGREALRPSLLGWANVECPDFVTPEQVAFKKDARRYEAGSPNLVGIAGMSASLEMLQEIGPETVERQVLAHTRRIREGVRERGFELACDDDEHLSGITSFRKDGADMAALHAKLSERKIFASLRSTRDRRQWIRFSPHFYNTAEEIDSALAALGS